ncbi:MULTISPECIES: MlaD family protein [Deefgea]|uniref:MCE family protein n=1 Tax=Deefgea chitinilytica TaxID=570276 RepID=A0ABS2CAM2_9NEIS|nr:MULTISPECIES: MlaD family protein [Deefgea]MBM5570503.1 MCE family protein [Deefgea chitinilytica]MBM9887732.1 MCE family protein [Deefgea sp. CFH1-16]
MKQVVFLKDNDPRFKWLSWRVGVFVGVLSVVILLLLLVLGERQGLFSSKDKIHFVAESGSGLKPGMQVRLSGFRIGVADRVELNEEAKVDVTLLIEQQYMKWIKEDSIAILQQEGLIGDHYIEIAGGTAKAKRLSEGGVLMFAPALGIADIAQNLSNRTLPMIDSVQQTFDYMNDPKGDLRLMFANVQKLTADLHETREKLDQLLARVDGVVNVEARGTLRSADQMLRRADSVAAEVNAKLSPVLMGAASIVVSADSAAQDASATMSVIRKTVEHSAPRVPSLLRNTDELIYGGRQTLDGLQQSWPLNSMLAPIPLDVPAPESRR